MDKLAIVVLQSFDSMDVFSLKGGWVLSKIFPTEFRRTIDVDLSINNVVHFETLIRNLEDECKSLARINEIHNYKIITPNPEKNRSGEIKLYRLLDDGRRYKISGVGVSVKCLDSCVVILNGSIPVFSFERMLADKFSVLHSDAYPRGMKDVFDSRLLIERCNLDKGKLASFCSELKIDFKYTNSIFSRPVCQLTDSWSNFIDKCSPSSYTDLDENLIVIKNFIESLEVIENE